MRYVDTDSPALEKFMRHLTTFLDKWGKQNHGRDTNLVVYKHITIRAIVNACDTQWTPHSIWQPALQIPNSMATRPGILPASNGEEVKKDMIKALEKY